MGTLKRPLHWRTAFEALEALCGRGEGPFMSETLLEVLEESRERVRMAQARKNGSV